MTCAKNVSKWSVAALSLGLGVWLGLVPTAPASAQPGPTGSTVVGTTHGKVRGSVDGQVRSFRGIPYAAPPVGERRWRAPEPAATWTGVREATAPGAACAQPQGLPIGVPSTSEGCLCLNVTTPTETDGKRPVIVWIHGGSLMYGTGDLYGPERLTTSGAVVVSMNYRLGVMGFLSDPSLPRADGLGIQDQQAALRWVRANAAAFGGAPENVTITGQSGGGYSVCDHLASPCRQGFSTGPSCRVRPAPPAAPGPRPRRRPTPSGSSPRWAASRTQRPVCGGRRWPSC